MINESRKIEKYFGKTCVFSEFECNEILESVKKLGTHWVPRGPSLGVEHFFYTLGATSYIDCRLSKEAYTSRVKSTNCILEENLGWMYDKIEKSLGRVIGDCARTSDLGFPGFHIFSRLGCQGTPDLSTISDIEPPAHYDIQHLYHKDYFESFQSFDFDKTLSFTIPILITSKDCGLKIIDPDMEVKFDSSFDNSRIKHRKCFLIDYTVGDAFYHFGKIKHQMNINRKTLLPGTKRITIQGHGILCDNRWLLYF